MLKTISVAMSAIALLTLGTQLEAKRPTKCPFNSTSTKKNTITMEDVKQLQSTGSYTGTDGTVYHAVNQDKINSVSENAVFFRNTGAKGTSEGTICTITYYSDEKGYNMLGDFEIKYK